MRLLQTIHIDGNWYAVGTRCYEYAGPLHETMPPGMVPIMLDGRTGYIFVAEEVVTDRPEIIRKPRLRGQHGRDREEAEPWV